MEPHDLYVNAGDLPLPFTETITLNVRQPGSPPTFTSYTVYRALRKRMSDTLRMERGLLEVQTRVFRVSQRSLDNAVAVSTGQPAAAPVPKPTDQIVDASGVKWVIIPAGVEYSLKDNVYHCQCQQTL